MNSQPVPPGPRRAVVATWQPAPGRRPLTSRPALPAAAPPVTPVPLWDLIRGDLYRSASFKRRPGGLSRRGLLLETIFLRAGWQAALLYRLAHWLDAHGWRIPALIVARLNLAFTGADIDVRAQIGAGLLIVQPVGVTIGAGVVIGNNATLFQGVSFGVRSWDPDGEKEWPKIGHDCFFFARASVVGGVEIGNRAVVGAHALVLEDVPEEALAVGVPAVLKPGAGAAVRLSWAA